MQTQIPPVFKTWKMRLSKSLSAVYDSDEQAYRVNDKLFASLTDMKPDVFASVMQIVDEHNIDWNYQRHVFTLDPDTKDIDVFREFTNSDGNCVYYRA